MGIPEAVGQFTIVVAICVALSATYAFVSERLRRPRRAKEHLSELEAWRVAQEKASMEQSRTYAESVETQKASLAQAVRAHDSYEAFNERLAQVQEARLRVAEQTLHELRRATQLLNEISTAVLQSQKAETHDGK